MQIEVYNDESKLFEEISSSSFLKNLKLVKDNIFSKQVKITDDLFFTEIFISCNSSNIFKDNFLMINDYIGISFENFYIDDGKIKKHLEEKTKSLLFEINIKCFKDNDECITIDENINFLFNLF